MIISKKLLLFSLIICISISIGYFFIFINQENFNFSAVYAEEEEEDKEPPIISDIKILDTTSSSKTIIWETDEEADSLVNYALKKDYGIIRDALLKKEHTIVLDNLLSKQMYYFRIISSDKQGNQSISNDYSFIIPETIEDEIQEGKGEGEGEGKGESEQSELIKNTLEMLEKISNEESLSLIESKIQNIAKGVVTPLTISGDFAKVEVGIDYAIITWKTDKEANSIVALASEKDYNLNIDDPYIWKEGEPNEMVLKHRIKITNLKPATTYHYKILSKSKLGLEAESDDSFFRTKSILPEIYNINIAKIEEKSATITWVTNVPCSAILEYTDLNTNETKLEGNSILMTTHSIKLSNLKLDTYYSVVIKVENEHKEETESDPLTFVTTKDEFPPVISKINTESTLYPGTENKTQTIVGWETDELSICQFFYQQGLTLTDEDKSFLAPEEDFTRKHVQVVTAFLPSSVYKFWIVCEDKSGNKIKSDYFTVLTPAQEESIIDLIIGNFEGTFGWLKKLNF